MILGIDWSTILSLISAFIAVFFIVLEHYKGPKPFRSWKLWLALIFLVISAVTTLVESISTKDFEKEQRADLLFIQKLNSGLNSLCFEINLKKPDPRYGDSCNLQLATEIRVANLSTTGLFADYIDFIYSPDRGWHRDKRDNPLLWPSITLSYDSVRNTVRFEMTPFGVSWKGQLAWKTERLADLAQVKFSLWLAYNAVPGSYSCPKDTLWSPVRSICLYANTYEPENLIATLVPMLRPHESEYEVIYFHPEGQAVKDSSWFMFNLDLLQMRSNILKSLDNKH